jgi:ABC-type branched-subunit amino acid transport system ATPase component
MQAIMIIAGPNGAGKTSFANEFLREHRKGLAFVNADEIARAIDGRRASPTADVRAAREMLRLSADDTVVAPLALRCHPGQARAEVIGNCRGASSRARAGTQRRMRQPAVVWPWVPGLASRTLARDDSGGAACQRRR